MLIFDSFVEVLTRETKALLIQAIRQVETQVAELLYIVRSDDGVVSACAFACDDIHVNHRV